MNCGLNASVGKESDQVEIGLRAKCLRRLRVTLPSRAVVAELLHESLGMTKLIPIGKLDLTTEHPRNLRPRLRRNRVLHNPVVANDRQTAIGENVKPLRSIWRM